PLESLVQECQKGRLLQEFDLYLKGQLRLFLRRQRNWGGLN
ncbi:uncharacterized protein METZ01_LOCUS374704, partial [marine metagenome]